MEKTKVLFIDDDTTLGNIVVTALMEEGYEVEYLMSLKAARSIIKEWKPNIMVLDVEIGADDGIDAIPEFRIEAPDTPIIFVSSHIASSEVARALKNGALSYLKKPFEIEELIAYINRYASPTVQSRIKIGTLGLDAETRLLSNGNVKIKRLSKQEFALLKLLYVHRDQLVLRGEIENTLWKDAVMNDHSLYNCIKKLREYLSADKDISLITIGGEGYKLQLTADELT